ncbi:hypothetical protein HELRODRAFT_174072 [Helobdella robusta]|uniref:C-type lectin domain-containing protein n=1 Tax=Helobdella robusta TaxID=6412 RepID=T1F7K1_HELRO|nr:hypothetical protein HELRODRAFT_174072 [Helobdella robusta]ESO03172.1 hypothetical protein HELRODRAFT_174072 [Helobdella robusta]
MIWIILMFAQFELLCCQSDGRLFSRAYSYLPVSGKKSAVCFDERMAMVAKIVAPSLSGCISKCLVYKSTTSFDMFYQIANNQNLLGVNYKTSEKSCSCVPKLKDIWFNVTTNLSGGCVAYVTHDCPKPFDFVVENQKCYLMITKLQSWMNARSACNNLHSHSLAVEDSMENVSSKLYALSVTEGLTSCQFSNFSGLMIWSSGIQYNKSSKAAPFYWEKFPGVLTKFNYSSWNTKQPDGALGSTSCMQVIMVHVDGWDDCGCSSKRCVLCEIDL